MEKEESKNGVAKAKERELEEREQTIIPVSTDLSHDPGSGMRFGSEVAFGAPLPFCRVVLRSWGEKPY